MLPIGEMDLGLLLSELAEASAGVLVVSLGEMHRVWCCSGDWQATAQLMDRCRRSTESRSLSLGVLPGGSLGWSEQPPPHGGITRGVDVLKWGLMTLTPKSFPCPFRPNIPVRFG